jgi:YfiH family protein
MPFQQSGDIRYYTFDSLNEAGVTHAVFTRSGGVSPAPWESLNVGLNGDVPERVHLNRERAFRAIGRKPETLFDVWQVHSSEAVCTPSPRLAGVPYIQADAILTDSPTVSLFMRFADCVPILLYDPVKHVAGIVHAGWQGTVKQAVISAVKAMQTRYGTQPRNILAAIGPSIEAHHYPVGTEVVERVRDTFGTEAAGLFTELNCKEGCVAEPGKRGLDLWAANRLLLERAGVYRVEIAGICTACHLDDWYSHRGEGANTGRFGALIGLSE